MLGALHAEISEQALFEMPIMGINHLRLYRKCHFANRIFFIGFKIRYKYSPIWH